MEPIQKDFKPIMILHDSIWQKAVECTDGTESFNERWFKADEIGFIPMSEITDWKHIE